MKLIVIGLLAATAWAGSPTRATQLAPISLFTQYQHAPEPAVMVALQEEVESILAAPGFRFDWHEISEAASAGTAVELAVVTFHGTCSAPGLVTPFIMATHTLGFTSVTDGEVLPFTTIDCDKTRSFLAVALGRLPASERAAVYGKALGRILAHELYHVFARTQRHGRAGVAKETYTVGDLMSDEFELDQRDCQVLKESRAYASLAYAASASDTR